MDIILLKVKLNHSARFSDCPIRNALKAVEEKYPGSLKLLSTLIASIKGSLSSNLHEVMHAQR